MSDNSEKIAQLRKEADELEAADAAFNTLPEEHRLAITLHDLQCHWNHTDGCGWYYEGSENKPDWNGYAHSEYLTKARNVIKFCCNHGIASVDAINLLKLVK